MRKISKKEIVIKHLKNFSDVQLKALYLERWLGANEHPIFIIANMDSGEQKILHRVSKNVFDWIETEEMKSDALNVRYFKILKLKQ